MKDLEKLLSQYKKLDFTPSIEDEKEQMYEYVYSTNKLEGNLLTLAQTTQLLSSDTISGDHIKTSDILEQKGMYKALSRMLKAVRDKEELTIELMLELNWLALSYLWKYEDAYTGAKSKGQVEGNFKISKNIIQIRKGGKVVETIDPFSTPENVNENMQLLLKAIASSDKPLLHKAVYLAQEVWLHQPFVDGNKRTGRLLINFLLMKEGYPLFSFESESKNYNNLLVTQYMEGQENIVVDYITDKLKTKMQYHLNIQKNIRGKSNGFRMIL